MRSSEFEKWITYGVLPPPDEDGRWDVGVWQRVEAATELAAATRTLARRAFRLQLLGFPFPTGARREAALAVLDRVRPKPGKMAQVLAEYDGFVRRVRGAVPGRPLPRLRQPVPADEWRRVVEAAPETALATAFENAGRYARMIPSVARSARIRERYQIPYEERFVLLLVNLLLQDPDVRRLLKLAPIPPAWTPPDQ